MACFLIDYENQTDSMIEGISTLGLTKKDEIIFFYTRHAKRISFALLGELEKIPAQKKYIEVTDGSNALDFQLSTYLGACINKNPKNNYYIVAKDLGYEYVCNFWMKKNVSVKRLDRICYFVSL